MPQKITRRPGARTSGTALRGFFGDGVRLTSVERLFETPPEHLPVEQDAVPRPARLESDESHVAVPVAVTPRVTLGLGQRTQPSHSHTLGPTPDGRNQTRSSGAIVSPWPRSWSQYSSAASLCPDQTIARPAL
jgi:hypothetical protein